MDKKKLYVKITQEEEEKLKELCMDEWVNKSVYIRGLINKNYKKLMEERKENASK